MKNTNTLVIGLFILFAVLVLISSLQSVSSQSAHTTLLVPSPTAVVTPSPTPTVMPSPTPSPTPVPQQPIQQTQPLPHFQVNGGGDD